MSDLKAIIQQGKQTLQDADPVEILVWAYERFAPHIALSCSFGGPGGIVLAHMAHMRGLHITVLFADTHFLFPETIALKLRLERDWGLDVRTLSPDLTPEEQAAQYGEALWLRDPDLCCHLRKVQPMAAALKDYRCWVTGLRRDQGESRREIQPLELHGIQDGTEMVKVNPLATWSKQDVWNYISRHQLPYNPLLDAGYRSIGCIQCTARVDTQDERAGRWKGFQKTECGLHTFTQVKR